MTEYITDFKKLLKHSLKGMFLLTGVALGAVFVKNIFTLADGYTHPSQWLPGYPGVLCDYEGDPELIGVCCF